MEPPARGGGTATSGWALQDPPLRLGKMDRSGAGLQAP